MVMVKVYLMRIAKLFLTLYSKNKILIEKLNKLKDKKFKPLILRLSTVFGLHLGKT